MANFDRRELFVQALQRLKAACAQPKDEFIRDEALAQTLTRSYD
ncbi:hypothetical protein SAMN05443662_1237 [Sulfurivirga caldicuralii]|uniref:Uncharacterized protein n=1 Tax=Sulfurivirga caldicuralii TaxID=364032 RepID=A0A1N6G8F9_9GAMM|nr:hypothetical protein [Sulfurivirga caldicuralii]SIO03849.1 hypothetical protein SAMN05443662_1237 [Sulfurivirga caldicuralii]